MQDARPPHSAQIKAMKCLWKEGRAWKAKMLLQKMYFYYTQFNSSHRYVLMPDGVERHLMWANDTKNWYLAHGARDLRGEKREIEYPDFVGILVLLIINSTISYVFDNEVVVLQDVRSNKVAINLMVNQLMGVSSESEIKEIACLFSDFVDGCLYVPINLPGFTYHTAMKERKGIIAKIKNTIANGQQQGGSIERSGVLGRLVEEENLNQIADFIINLLFAGNKTTTKTVLFIVYFLTQCPQALELLLIEHECIRRRIHKEILEWDDYRAILFNQCVIDETLKLECIAIWLLREAKENVDDKDFTIPQGYLIVPFLLVIHLDEGIYPGALPFNPRRRLAEENKEKRNWKTSPYFSPFGGGARFCPGAEISLFLIAVTLQFLGKPVENVSSSQDWQLSSEESSICTSPKEGFTYSDLIVVQQFLHMTFSSLQPDWFTIGSLLLAFTHPNKFVDIYLSCKTFDPGGLLMIITHIPLQMTRLDEVELF